MEATRVRYESLIEWAVAAGFLVAMLAAGSVVVREFQTITAITPAIAANTRPSAPAPAGVPSRAVSVPMLLLADGREVRVGDTLMAIVARLGRQAEVGIQAVERAVHGERLTRFYEHAGTQFVLVFEPFEQGADPRVAAIYLQ